MAVPQPDLAHQRQLMVEHQLAGRGIRAPRVLQAMATLRRELFVPAHAAASAYEDRPLPIGAGQTISQPFVVARMLAALELTGTERVLEVGTGSGYVAALLAMLAREVFTIERHAQLARTAAEHLARSGFPQVHVRRGDGTLGWPEHAPFDAILVSAGGPRVPPALRSQLAAPGRLVMPVGEDQGSQTLLCQQRLMNGWRERALGSVVFVPLVGAQGWSG
ncbi:MAG: protein-L-isoaspartate(D-aspartate) O-methyltransferase [Planctomycetes bacterium]|nr:protein-L-isoaspartate(D-aspartate) O-methyltransferase [Planctomycetota bacterium]MCB9887797.1 protein-L-isoaspartate(D-aspartate) O-methyltransferase [Planctomycetota bacterium]